MIHNGYEYPDEIKLNFKPFHRCDYTNVGEQWVAFIDREGGDIIYGRLFNKKCESKCSMLNDPVMSGAMYYVIAPTWKHAHFLREGIDLVSPMQFRGKITNEARIKQLEDEIREIKENMETDALGQ